MSMGFSPDGGVDYMSPVPSLFDLTMDSPDSLLQDEIKAVELLMNDPRPTLVIDLQHVASQPSTFFCNAAFRRRPELVIDINTRSLAANKFKDWALGNSSHKSESCSYRDSDWVRFIVKGRWILICSSKGEEPPTPLNLDQLPVRQSGPKRRRSSNIEKIHNGEASSHNLPSLLDFSEHYNHIRSIDWASTSLGCMESWPNDIRQLLDIMMLDPRPSAMCLGPENLLIYNEAYAPLVGKLHPSILGTRAQDTGLQMWETISKPVEIRPGKALDRQCKHLVWEKEGGRLEELFLAWCLIPLTGSFFGFYQSVSNLTEQCVAQRRLSTLLTICKNIGETESPHEVSSFGQAVLDGVSINSFDFPIAMIYSLRQDYEAHSPSSAPGSMRESVCFLKGKLGIPDNHLAAPKKMELWTSEEGFAPVFRDAVLSSNPILLRANDGTLPKHLIDGLQPRGFGDRCQAIIVCPIRSIGFDYIAGFLVIGLNSRVSYNEEYKQLIALVCSLLAESAISIIQDLHLTRPKGVAQNGMPLSFFPDELSLRLQESHYINERLHRFQLVAEMSGVGMFDCHPSGRLIQANETWYRLSGHSKIAATADMHSFMDCVFEADLGLLKRHWESLQAGKPATFEMRWKPIGEDGKRVDDAPYGTWVLATCIPVLTYNGSVASISGCTTDIRAQKKSVQDALDRADALERAAISEKRFESFARLAPVAIYILNIKGEMLYCNEKWFELTGSPPQDFKKINWLDSVLEEDVGIVQAAWKTLTEDMTSVKFQYRLKRHWKRDDGAQVPTWIMSHASYEFDEGTEKNTFGVMIEVSDFKWAEDFQRQRTEDALEAKRQQENFIDMTSHEIRNPLSAVLQCADSIASWLHEISISENVESIGVIASTTKIQEIVHSCLEAVKTITACTTHQNRIIDDILTFSKLDSHLLSISPTKIQPKTMAGDCLNMFRLQLDKARIQTKFLIDDSLANLEVDWVMLDPSRVLQVLINLLTNAIKFTKAEAIRKITLTLSASQDPPSVSQGSNSVKYISTAARMHDVTQESDWGTGEIIYISISVQDSGCGLSRDECGRLFVRFMQASPRTHIHYGGAGLGLFISRELCELQGGRIGVASESKKGSTFAFYVKARRAQSPLVDVDSAHQVLKKTLSVRSPFLGTVSVLVVEDNLINQKVLCEQLRQLGWTTYSASHGGEVLSFLCTSNFWEGKADIGKPLSVILMDIEMPIMDGLTCVRKIRELESQGIIYGHVPVIGVSANVRVEQIAHARICGMDDFVCKPFRVADLKPKIERLIMSGRKSDQQIDLS